MPPIFYHTKDVWYDEGVSPGKTKPSQPKATKWRQQTLLSPLRGWWFRRHQNGGLTPAATCCRSFGAESVQLQKPQPTPRRLSPGLKTTSVVDQASEVIALILDSVVSKPGLNRREAGYGRAAETGNAFGTSHTAAADSRLHHSEPPAATFGRLPKGIMPTCHGLGAVVLKKNPRPQTA